MSMDGMAAANNQLCAIRQRLMGLDVGALPELAMELFRLGVRLRGSVGPRGTISRTGEDRLLDGSEIEHLAKGLDINDPKRRGEVALGLSEVGGVCSSKTLSERLLTEKNDVAQMYFVSSLGVLGGVAAANALAIVAKNGATSNVRAAAATAYDELLSAERTPRG